MGLSRLENFLKSTRGNILYVNPNDLDATDSIENQGNSLTRPFKTIQRALVESSRFSYQKGLDNDRFAKTTILLYPGDHVIDNRPGWIPDGSNNYRLRNGTTSDDFPAFDLTTNFDLENPNNELYKLNSIYGGVIVPRGTSIVGFDVRKTKLRPKYVPSPTNDDIERTCVFRLTGGCYLAEWSIFDANPNGKAYVDYTTNQFVPNFSHHKLTVFEFADGVNDVKINDEFISDYTTNRTDLTMYYEKVGLAYGQSSGRAIEPDYPSTSIDIQAKVDEYRIVGSRGASVGISSVYAGDATTADTTITVTLDSALSGLDVDTPFRISGVSASGYDGKFVVAERPSDTILKYTVQNTPTTAAPTATGATLTLSSDTVTGSSPYVFNVSLRSVYGMCGMEVDGNKASGFKSMVVAQFTGIGLQKDDNAFVRFNTDDIPSGNYDTSLTVSNLSTNSHAVYKPAYENYHLKISNDGVCQAVSCFAIGYAQHFLTTNGGDMSLTNSNSNFGAKALSSKGFRPDAYSQDDVGYITHIIPPKEVPLAESAVEFEAIDVNTTLNSVSAGIGSVANLYLYNQSNQAVKPENVLEGYRVGARENDQLRALVSYAGSVTEYTSRIVMDGWKATSGEDLTQVTAEKIFTVKQSATGINSIGSNSAGGNDKVITFTAPHSFINGESVRILSNDGQVPDGVESNVVYYAVTSGSGIATNTNIKVAKTLNEALNDIPLAINNKGGLLKVISRVSDKLPGDKGHPIQWSSGNSQWYVNVATAATENTLYPRIVGLGSTGLGEATTRTFIKRKTDSRNAEDTVYRMRYVVPAASGITVARPPLDGYIIQESNTGIGGTDAEVLTYYGSGSLANVNQQRNFSFIADANWDNTHINVTTELPHDLSVGSGVELVNVKSTKNTTGTAGTGYNRYYEVVGISSAKTFSVGLTTNPGTFSNDTSARTTALPYFKRKRYSNVYYVYTAKESQDYIAGKQDGVYYLTVVNATNKPTVSPFKAESFSQPLKQLYPQTNRDTPVSDPLETKSFAVPDTIGKVVVDNTQNSITKETLNKYINDTDIGIGITNIVSHTGTAHTITTTLEHGFNRVVKVGIDSGGAGYGSGTAGDVYNAQLVGIGTSTTGQGATAKLTVNGSGTITGVQIMDGGSAYGIGNTMNVVGVATTTGFVQGVLSVQKIYSNIGDTVRISGVSSESYVGYNQLYRISDVVVGQASSVTVASASSVSGISTVGSLGIGKTLTANTFMHLTGESVSIDTLTYDFTAGIATVTTNGNHGLEVDERVEFVGAGQTQYNGKFVITKDISLTSFAVNMGAGTTSPTKSGTMYAYREGFAANGGVITVDNENVSGRMVSRYAGITTTLAAAISNSTTPTISIQDLNLGNLDVRIGDYLVVDNEMMRVKTTTVSGDATVTVFRGVMGTQADSHDINSVIRRVKVDPIELRRHSLIRASAHTFEYLGYGPGNYSTAFPSKQNRDIDPTEQRLAQSFKQEGGVNFFTGMNDKGISYTGNKKVSTITGKEEIVDTPVQTVTGEDIANLPELNVSDATEFTVKRSLKVEGGDNNKITSEFNGPLVVNNKLTVSSDKGLEANSVYLQGDTTVSRKYTVGLGTPTLAANPGDVSYYANPDQGGYAGWVYTSENDWKRFGNISLSKEADILALDQVGIGTTTPGVNTFQVGAGSTIFSVDGVGVGIGTTAGHYKLQMIGDGNIVGTVTATAFAGDGSGLTGLTTSLFGWTNVTDGLYNTDLDKVGLGTISPRFNAEIGFVGMGTTSLWVNGEARFADYLNAKDVNVSGIITAANLNVTSGNLTVGLATLTNIKVGSSSTIMMTTTSGVGIGTQTPRAELDVTAHTRLKSHSEEVGIVTVTSNQVNIYLNEANSFICTVTDNVDRFRIYNADETSATSFTLKLTQDGTGGRNVGIDTMNVGAGGTMPVYWPGGVVPGVTTTASRTDIYSFKIFDGADLEGQGIFGVITGQNFLN